MSFIAIALFLYIISDVNWFLNTLFTVVRVRIFATKRKITEKTTIYGFCTLQDVGILIPHMNNARYFRELDFARTNFFALTRFFEEVMQKGGSAVQGASSIRYRRTIPIFAPYKVETRLVWWDEKAIYFEQKFITLMDGFVRALAFSKQSITSCNVMDVMKRYPEANTVPTIPKEFKLWQDANEVSSQKLRKDK